MGAANDIRRIEACLQNKFDRKALENKNISGVIGESPSHYSKSPPLWNAVFASLGMDAAYLPLDVEESRLADLLQALKSSTRVMGVNVTVPYKMKVMEYLDGLDERARRIQAVNTIVRTAQGRLVGYNTDGQGFLDGILIPQPGKKEPFAGSLRGLGVLMIGAGGAGRAVAFSLAEKLGSGRLFICNRTAATARALADEINLISGNARAVTETDIAELAPQVGLIVNCSIKGQGGIRRMPDGTITSYELYSALAPAHPSALPESEYGKPEFYRDWLSASIEDIELNNRLSLRRALSAPLDTGFCDLIYFPEETVFLRHGRLSGHRTLNGRGMIVAQAAGAFFKICKTELAALGADDSASYERIVKIMYHAW
ncbi:MAG: hypothetical protein HY695_38990 [Deltaproteobacteria bacterium]|nr:hypothetical protein [Deltaproteobacteria bacterium]